MNLYLLIYQKQRQRSAYLVKVPRRVGGGATKWLSYSVLGNHF